MSLPDLLEGDQSICHSEDKDILRQGKSQQALQQSCERAPTRVIAMKVGKRARSQKTDGASH